MGEQFKGLSEISDELISSKTFRVNSHWLSAAHFCGA